MGIFSLFFNKSKPEQSSSLELLTDKKFYKQLIDNDSSMILFFTEKEGWIGANETFFKHTKLHDIAEFLKVYDGIRDIFMHESEKIFTEDDKGWLDFIMKNRADGYKVRMLNATGEPLVLNAKVLFDDNTHIYTLELEDITNLERERLKTKDVEALKTKFLANIGHEFRTPMNAILGFMELLEDTTLNDIQKEYLKMVSYSAQNLMVNIETLLELSQLQSGRLKLNEDEFNFVEELEKLTYSFYKEAKIRNIRVLTFIDPKIPKYITSDAAKIIQIVYSIIHHSIKLTKEGGKILIEIKLSKIAADGSCSIGFAFKDNGEGLSKEQIALINEPFSADAQASERLGVGLSLSSGLIKLLGSNLRIHSEKYSGSYLNFVLHFKHTHGKSYEVLEKKRVKVLLLDQTKLEEAHHLSAYLTAFGLEVVKSNVIEDAIYDDIEALYIVASQKRLSWVLELAAHEKTVPIIMVLDDGEHLHANLKSLVDKTINLPLLPSRVAQHLELLENYDYDKQKIGSLKMREQVRALVVEDNVINQKLIQILLEEYDISVDTALNGLEAVELCEQKSFDIIFMDIDMPYMNGIVATQEIKDNIFIKSTTPIVALTAMAMQGDKEMLLREGLDDYLAKPLTREKLEYILEKYLKVEQKPLSV
jgi:signal transduction histidine kinase/CheY-like chemotaxis protein